VRAAFLLFSLLSASQILALEEPDSLESLFSDASAIATKSSLNTDYMPSVATVIEADTFRDAGIQNLSEALDMLPGFQIQISPAGYPMTTVLGLKNPNAYLSDKIKIMIDGIDIHNEISGSSYFFMDFPMQLIEKIEVLRGPASTLYGAGSFYATINVITKTGKGVPTNRVLVGTGSYEYLTGGMNLYVPAGAWDLFFDGYYQRNNKQLFSQQHGPWGRLNVMGKSDERMEDFSIGFTATRGGFSFQNRFKRNHSGNFYGFEGKFDPMPQRDSGHGNTYFFSQATYKQPINGATLELKANFSHREERLDANIYSEESTAFKFKAVDINMTDGFYIDQKQTEQNWVGEAVLTLPEWNKNTLLLGAGARYVAVTKDDFHSSIDTAISANREQILNHPNYDDFRYREGKEPAYWANPTTTLLPEDTDRTIYYAYGQDLITVTPAIDLVLGLRFDHYSDFGTQWSKRAALVYRTSDTLILKLLYGSAFRAPTFIEAYQNGHINTRAGDAELEPEQTDTYEAVAVFKPDAKNKFLLTLFYSYLKDVIDLEEQPDTIPGYQNFDSRTSRGVELEYYFRHTLQHNLYFNATVLNTDYIIPPEEGEEPIRQSMPDISKVMLKGMYTYRPSTLASFSVIWRYFSETTPTELNWVKESGIDSTVDAVHIFDLSMTYRFTPASITRFSVKNLFDADIRDPAYYYLSDGGVQREGMNFHLSFEQQF
jgi:outer membrane receptor protein involved in Fe transport